MNEAAQADDFLLCSIVCKTLWNFSLDNGNHYFSQPQVELLKSSVKEINTKAESVTKDSTVEAYIHVATQVFEMLEGLQVLIPLNDKK